MNSTHGWIQELSMGTR